MSYPTLCQDCLAEIILPCSEDLFAADSALEDGNRLCHCGGDVCDCNGCLSTLEKLRAGCRDYKELGLREPIDDQAWSPSRGLFRKANHV